MLPGAGEVTSANLFSCLWGGMYTGLNSELGADSMSVTTVVSISLINCSANLRELGWGQVGVPWEPHKG